MPISCSLALPNGVPLIGMPRTGLDLGLIAFDRRASDRRRRASDSACPTPTAPEPLFRLAAGTLDRQLQLGSRWSTMLSMGLHAVVAAACIVTFPTLGVVGMPPVPQHIAAFVAPAPVPALPLPAPRTERQASTDAPASQAESPAPEDGPPITTAGPTSNMSGSGVGTPHRHAGLIRHAGRQGGGRAGLRERSSHQSQGAAPPTRDARADRSDTCRRCDPGPDARHTGRTALSHPWRFGQVWKVRSSSRRRSVATVGRRHSPSCGPAARSSTERQGRRSVNGCTSRSSITATPSLSS